MSVPQQKAMSPIDPRRYSDASTFVTPGEDAEHRLLEEFTVDDSDMHAPDAASPRDLPLLYTPAYARTHKAIGIARIAILVLNFPKLVIPIFGAPDTLTPFLPVGLFTTIFVLAPMIMTLTDAWSHKPSLLRKIEGEGQGVRSKVGDERVAVLVEDPVTGEERWMLQMKAQKQGDEDGVENKRWFIATLDVICAGVYLLGMFLVIYWGLDSPNTLAADMTVMVIQL
jgi:hypothetical protein